MDVRNWSRSRSRKSVPVDAVTDFLYDQNYIERCASLANVPTELVKLSMHDFVDYIMMIGQEETGIEMRKHFWNWFRVNIYFLVKQKHTQFASWVLPS